MTTATPDHTYVQPDRSRIGALLAKAEATCPILRDQLAERLDAGAAAYGNTWAARPATELIAEATEEATDLAAWAALAEQHPELAALDPLTRESVEAHLVDAIRHSQRAHAHLAVVLSRLTAGNET